MWKTKNISGIDPNERFSQTEISGVHNREVFRRALFSAVIENFKLDSKTALKNISNITSGV